MLHCNVLRHQLRAIGWPPLTECSGPRAGKCPTECFLSAFGQLPRSAPRSAFRVLFGVFSPKRPKSTQKALFGALRGNCPKALKKHSVGHFPARGPEHSCKWRPGLNGLDLFSERKKHININKCGGGGGKILFMCFFFGSFLMGEKNT